MSSKKMTVVVVNDFDYIQGGASKVAIDTAEILYDNNVDVILFSAVHKSNDYKFKQVTTNQKECLKDGLKGAIRGLYNFKAAREFKKLLKTLDRDNTIIHVHGWTKALSSSIFKITNKLKFKTVLTLHDYFTICPNGGFFNYRKCEICKKNALSFDCIKTNCDSRNYFFKLYRVIRQFIQKKNMKNLKNVISISDFSERIIKEKINNWNIYRVYNPIDDLGLEKINIENNKYYLFVGRVSKEKGVDIFCDVINNNNLNGIVVGDGDQKEFLEKKYPNIKFTGWLCKNEVYEYMSNAKALVFPSKWYEGAPLTILEAQSIGLPCFVSSNCAGVDFINEKKNGFVFADSNELTRKIKEFEKYNTEEMARISDSTLKIYQEEYLSKNYYQELMVVYETLVKENEK